MSVRAVFARFFFEKNRISAALKAISQTKQNGVQTPAGTPGIRREELKNVYIAYPDVPGSVSTWWGIENYPILAF